MKMEQTGCSETLVFKLQTPGNNPKKNVRHSKHDESLKSRSSLRVFENKVLRRIFGSKRDEVTGENRKPHNVLLNDLYCSPNTFG
jgi:hypothetical protein